MPPPLSKNLGGYRIDRTIMLRRGGGFNFLHNFFNNPPQKQLYCYLDPTLSDDHVQLISTTNFTVTLRIPNIACIDENGDISEFRISYAETSDFIEGVNLKNGFFSPGVLTVGNLSPGRNYTFQLTVTTVHGGRAVLEPVEAETDSGE